MNITHLLRQVIQKVNDGDITALFVLKVMTESAHILEPQLSLPYSLLTSWEKKCDNFENVGSSRIIF